MEHITSFFSVEEKYFVEDLYDSASQQSNEAIIIFILESPYSSEVIAQHPLAGRDSKDAGLAVSRLFFGQDASDALGCLINQGQVNNIFILNVCNIPMDIGIYCGCQNISDELVLLDWLRNAITSNEDNIDTPKFRKGRNEKNKEIIKLLIDCLNNRLNRLLSPTNFQRKVIIVPCGNIARAFFKKTSFNIIIYKILSNIKHPARNQWSEEDLIAIRREIIEYLMPDTIGNTDYEIFAELQRLFISQLAVPQPILSC